MPAVTKEYEFQNDTVKVEFKRMTREQMMSVSPYLRDEGDDANPGGDAKMMDISADILSVNIISFTGLKDKEGNAIDKDTFLSNAYFFSLLGDLIKDLVRESLINPKQGKESEQDSTKYTEGSQAPIETLTQGESD